MAGATWGVAVEPPVPGWPWGGVTASVFSTQNEQDGTFAHGAHLLGGGKQGFSLIVL